MDISGFQLIILTLMGALVVIAFTKPHKPKPKDPQYLSSAHIALALARKIRKSKNEGERYV